MWDDVKKRCEEQSTTCDIPSTTSHPTPVDPIHPSTTNHPPPLDPSQKVGNCVSECSGMPDGNYQSCETCTRYISCSNGNIHDQACPAKLVWDDVKKRCEEQSTTCDIPSTTSHPTPVNPIHPSTTNHPHPVDPSQKVGDCVTECSGMPDGNYQSCETCTRYVSCSNGNIHDQACPAKLVWDDVKKRCEEQSTTCDIPSTTSHPPPVDPAHPSTTTHPAPVNPKHGKCVSDCNDMPDGHYQSCETCMRYVSCSNGDLFDRDCPAKLVWDDIKKRCEYESTTCDIPSVTRHPPPVEPTHPSTTTHPPPVDPKHGKCVSDCNDMPDGHYQSCETCRRYVSCSNGDLFDRDCPAKLVWDDVKKRCEYESTTCDIPSTTRHPPSVDPSTTTHPPPVDPKHGKCVSDCKDLPDGDYQSCDTCRRYVSCSNGNFYDRPCPAKLVWDDVKKRCEYESTTCDMLSTTIHPSTTVDPIHSSTTSPTPTGHPTGKCVSDCNGVSNGDYQSCKTCEGYVTCSNGYYSDRPCPANLVWDDVKKRCEWESATCPRNPSHSTTTPDPSGGDSCVSDCSGVANGDYQSCKTCEGYVTCSNGYYFDRPCPANLVWDDVTKRCEWESATCPRNPSHSTTTPDPSGGDSCVSDCSGVANGDYQSCKTCEGYVTCSNGYYFDRPCPANLVWDDVKKRCEWDSATCPPYTSPPSTTETPSPSTPSNPKTTDSPYVPPGTCVSDCRNMPDGKYQSCKTCKGYVTCTKGLLCEEDCDAPFLWDDVTKTCKRDSTTCPIPTRCVSDCSDMPDGDYQSCKTCEGYVTCYKGLICEHACPKKFVWDDVTKLCKTESTTCHTPSPSLPYGCVSDCSGVANGDYQSCKTCEGYVTCSNGYYSDRPCPANLVWDDVKKRCEWESTTCPGTPSHSTTTPDPSGRHDCVSDCSGVANGDYQSCKTCKGYVTCSNGYYFDRPCPANLVWDDVKKRCEWESTTCPGTPSHSTTPPDLSGRHDCVSDCSDVANGDYQSCKTCKGYVTCSNGYYFDRPCPANLVWDDVKKRCEWESTTCPGTPSHSTTTPDLSGRHDCVSDCNGVANGDYQSCKTCKGYVTCSNGYYFDRPCPANLVWDDVKKRCEWESTTCPGTPSRSTTTPVPSGGHSCVSDCNGVANGDYQSCKTCKGYVTCSNGYHSDRPCPANLVWDDVKKRCEWKSPTCDIV